MDAYRRMPRFPRFPKSVWIALAAIWLAASASAWFLLPQHIPFAIRIPFLIAACIELFFFVPLGWASVREDLLGRFTAPQIALGMTLSAMLPFLVYTVGTGVVSVKGFLLLAFLALLVSFWYVLLPGGKLRDAGFLLLVAGVTLSGVFREIYPDAAPKLQAEFLGRILWIRLGIAAALLLRRMAGTGFGWWPSLREWRIGTLGFLALFPVLFLLGWWVEFFTLREPSHSWPMLAAITVGTFFGMFWVVALSEEFFLRGLLQQWLCEWSGSFRAGLLLTSLISGALHLPFREFPNWRFALLATVAHAAYGYIFGKAGGIRAPMVTHALVVVVWRVFLE